jgi:hypothetical protein
MYERNSKEMRSENCNHRLARDSQQNLSWTKDDFTMVSVVKVHYLRIFAEFENLQAFGLTSVPSQVLEMVGYSQMETILSSECSCSFVRQRSQVSHCFSGSR